MLLLNRLQFSSSAIVSIRRWCRFEHCFQPTNVGYDPTATQSGLVSRNDRKKDGPVTLLDRARK